MPKKFLCVVSLLFVLCAVPVEMIASASAADPKQLRVVTYNVLSDARLKTLRVPTLLALLKEADADVIALQEVAPWFVVELREAGFLERYHVPLVDGRVDHRGGLLILSKSPVLTYSVGALPSAQGRRYLIVETQIGARKFAIATCHLESYLEDGLIRARQLDLIFAKLAAYEHALCMGDFNFGDGEQPESKHLPKTYHDAWLGLKPKDPGYTWNKEKSLMAWRASFAREDSRRLDRVLCRSSALKPQAIRIIGDQAVPDNNAVFPSDHFGLCVDYLLLSD